MKAKLIKPWEEDATRWPEDRKAAIKFARQEEDGRLFCVHPRGTTFDGAKAEHLIALGLAEQVAEVRVIEPRRLEE